MRDVSEPSGVEDMAGPGLRLVAARQRMERAVLAIFAQSVSETYVGAQDSARAYTEMSAAARQLVLAQNAWDDYVEAKHAERVGP